MPHKNLEKINWFWMPFLNRWNRKEWMILLCLLVPSIATSQTKNLHVCSYYGDKVRAEVVEGRFRMRPGNNQQAISMVERIVNASGLPQNFEIYASSMADNAFAMVDEYSGQRLIVYNESFMLGVQQATKRGWGAMSILAHEVGHHLGGHTLDGFGSRPSTELEADRFSGFILYKLGASLEEAQEAMRFLASEEGSTTHPPRSKRLQAITEGFFDAKQKFPRSESANSGKTNPSHQTSTNFRSGFGENYRYTGEMKNGKPHGNGKATYENGWMLVYEGSFVNGIREGYAKVLYRNGDRYEGQYEQDVRGGRGKYFWKNGDTYEGLHRNNKFNGSGKRTWAVSGDVLEGNFVDDSIHGTATYRWGNGDVFIGDYQNGVIQGRGVKQLRSGAKYEGEWKNGKRHGFGTYRYADGTIYKGFFENNLRHGEGTRYDKQGRVIESGRWALDRLIR